MQNNATPDQQNENATVKTVRLIGMPADGPTPTPEGRLGERLKYARAQLELNIDALSRLTEEYDSNRKGVSPTSISRYESGENLPGTFEFRLLCDALDVPAQWLLYGEVPNAGKNEYEQNFLSAMKNYVRSVAAENISDELVVKPYLQFVVRGTRDQLLEKAKKPRPRKSKE